MCQFDPSNEQDKNNYFFVEGNLSEMCEAASQQGQLVMSSLGILPEMSSPDVISEEHLRRRLDAL
jgi:hypothetical protein